MADEEIKIKIKVDDSEEKKYDAEHKARLKVQTVAEIEAEKRKTLDYKAAIKDKQDARKKAEKDAIRGEERIAEAQRKSIDEQIKNVNRLAEAEKKRISDIESKAIKNLNKAATSNRVNSTLGGFTGGSINEIRTQISELKKFRDALAVNDPMIGKVNVRIRELRQSLGLLTNTSKTSSAQLLEMGENMATIGIALKLAGMQIWAMVKPLKDFAVQSITTGAELTVLRQNFNGSAKDIELFKKATAGTVTEASLIKLSNQATDLGLTLEQQALFFSLAEDKADKYGGSVEENFQKLLFATESGTKGLKNVGIETAKYNEELTRLVKEQKGSVEISQSENGEKEITIKNLDAETQKRLKVQAVLNLSGVTLDQINNKQKDNKDIIDALGVTYEEFSSSLGAAFGESSREMVDNFNKTIQTLGLSSENTGLTVGKVAGAIGQAIGAIIKYGNVLGIVINTFPKFVDGLKSIYNGVQMANKILGLPIPGGWASSLYGALDGVIEKVRQAIYYLGLLPSEKAGVELPANKGNKDIPIKPPKGKGDGGNSKTADQKETLNLIDLEKEKLAKLNEQLTANLGDYGSELQIRRQILEVELEIFRLRTGQKIDLGKSLSGLNSIGLVDAGVRERFIGKNSRAGNDPLQDMSTEELTKNLADPFAEIKNYSSETVGFFNNILGLAGATNSEFMQILNAVSQIINAGSGIFDFIGLFIPGASAIGGLVGGGGIAGKANGLSSMNSGTSQGYRIVNNQPIIIQGTLSGQRFLKAEFPKYNTFKGKRVL